LGFDFPRLCRRSLKVEGGIARRGLFEPRLLLRANKSGARSAPPAWKLQAKGTRRPAQLGRLSLTKQRKELAAGHTIAHALQRVADRSPLGQAPANSSLMKHEHGAMRCAYCTLRALRNKILKVVKVFARGDITNT
jgi:hypothetical protein